MWIDRIKKRLSLGSSEQDPKDKPDGKPPNVMPLLEKQQRIEHGQTLGEADVRRRQVADQTALPCGWCNHPCDPDKDGFHLAHVAFGATQERYTFCSDECFEAFRRMYPARVHRDCYDRRCTECELCVKRYGDETDSLRLLTKDYLNAQTQP